MESHCIVCFVGTNPLISFIHSFVHVFRRSAICVGKPARMSEPIFRSSSASNSHSGETPRVRLVIQSNEEGTLLDVSSERAQNATVERLKTIHPTRSA
jgi:hypothetical protein